ncbi:flavin-dependent oxidoreductase [Mycolicibacter virginiensis]|uniref:Flavin-dependent oxidoreductase n=1 Tax=Mycolicibacter virginiensis TaxID=1795032 RepID=A0A9X7ILE7_9MYCO|nr:FAD-dependent monooxygenase [Mycolicibacter virginiensis]PQM51405.1 flavin-dependent oxidoreductase [Mycolicibacter virginiensis]
MTDVVIAGAGIGGLTTALTLHACAIPATVVESARELRPLGVGINLLPHAVREVFALGLGERLSALAVAPTSLAYFDTRGRELFREPRGLAGGYEFPQYSVHRGDLQLLLLDAVRERLGAGAIRTGSRVTGFVDDGDAVRVQLGDDELAGAVLVGADGIHSAVRAQLHPDGDELRWSGVRMWRGAAPGEPYLDGQTMAIVKADDGIELVIYRIGAGLINWVLLVPEAQPGPLPDAARWNQRCQADQVLDYLDGWRLDWLDVADLVSRTAGPLEYPMVDRDPLPWWGRGRVTLLGDAAHPMYPVGANGGSQAILDARALADSLAAHPDTGLRAYEEHRREATAAVVAANREMHRRGAILRSDNLARVAAAYRRDTGADRARV